MEADLPKLQRALIRLFSAPFLTMDLSKLRPRMEKRYPLLMERFDQAVA